MVLLVRYQDFTSHPLGRFFWQGSLLGDWIGQESRHFAIIKGEEEEKMIHMSVIGYGYWGPNVVRNFRNLEGLKVVSICDLNPDRLKRAQRDHPDLELTSDFNDILSSPKIDAVAVVTPVSTHFDLGKKALENGKHLFIEKPFTYTVAEAEELIEIAERKNLKIMVDHTFLFTGAVNKMKELIDQDTLGKLYYFDSTRVNLGLFQHDVNVIWDLAPHDFSIMDYLVKDKPTAVVATGGNHLNGMEDVAYITVYFSNQMIAHFNVNWLSPVKVRTALIGGIKRMLVWNDLDVDEKIKVYDKGIDVKNGDGVYNLLVSYRSGDMWVPKVEQTEALRLESEYFVKCVSNDETPINDGQAGLRVVKMLEAANQSLRNESVMTPL
jgi:predicted dehydrogenase